MTFQEYHIFGQEIAYSVYTFPFKPLAFADVFLQEEKFRRLLPHLSEICSIGSEKPSINTFQGNKVRKGYLPFGKMQLDGKKELDWLTKYNTTQGWRHHHTDFWIPQKTKTIKNYAFPEIVICINGGGKPGLEPKSEHYFSNNFSVIIRDDLLTPAPLEKVTNAMEAIKKECYDCYYFHFKSPWIKIDSVFVGPGGSTSFVARYQLADVDGAFLSLKCIDYFTDCHWKNIYCDESEIIERQYLTRDGQ